MEGYSPYPAYLLEESVLCRKEKGVGRMKSRSFMNGNKPPALLPVLGVLCAVCLSFGACASYAAPSDVELIKNADMARGNLRGVSWNVSIIASEPGRSNQVDYAVQARGYDIVAVTVAPANHKDERVVMVKGNMWFYKPGLNKPVPISQRQKLMGNAAYGDIASTNYAEDYDAVPAGVEVVDGDECQVFDLKAKRKETTYDRIKYWISKKSMCGIRADYFTVSGKRLKSSEMEYSNQVKDGGETRRFISKIVIRDELMSDNITTMTFSKPSIQPVPDHVFNLNLMQK